MDDGAKLGSGFTFSINYFQKKEVELLIQVLTENFILIVQLTFKEKKNIEFI